MKETITENRNREVIQSLYNTIYNIVNPKVAHDIFSVVGARCADTYVKYRKINTSGTFDDFIKSISDVPAEQEQEGRATEVKHKRTIRKEGNTIYWTIHVGGKCVCHLVRNGFLELSPRLCMCSTNWVKRNIERFTRTPVRVELIDSPAFGGQDCVFKATIMGEELPIYDTSTATFFERSKD